MQASLELDRFLGEAPRFLFFTGKGGVGKTSLSCATALALARRGRRVLLISTDPASNLNEVLETRLGARPVRVAGDSGLWAVNIDPESAAREYRERLLAPYRETLPAAMLAGIEEQLSGACTTEIAAFNEFASYLGDASATEAFDHVVFDTAPTGHTLRLLQLPAAWHQFIDSNAGGASCLGPLTGLAGQKELYRLTLEALRSAERTQLVLVSRPEPSSLAEAERTRAELAAQGLSRIALFINGVHPGGSGDEIACAMVERQQAALAGMAGGLRALPTSLFRLQAFNITGRPALESLFAPSPLLAGNALPEAESFAALPGLGSLVDDIERGGPGVILAMGKGGVGKTTIASAIAVELARRGHSVQLSTTDPAAHLDSRLAESVPGLVVSRIDPAAETRAYAADVLATAGEGLDDEDRRLLEEDLRSPCTGEIAVFRAFAAQVDRGREQFVVLDTAPTGHTLLLLDATEAYHREVMRSQSELPEAVRQLLPRLRDPAFSRVLIVALPEFTPVHEAATLQGDLRRAGIEPYAWVVNQSLTPLAPSDPLLAARRLAEATHLEQVARVSTRAVLIPWQRGVIDGAEALCQLVQPNLECVP